MSTVISATLKFLKLLIMPLPTWMGLSGDVAFQKSTSPFRTFRYSSFRFTSKTKSVPLTPQTAAPPCTW